jgi:hypothetical protein
VLLEVQQQATVITETDHKREQQLQHKIIDNERDNAWKDPNQWIQKKTQVCRMHNHSTWTTDNGHHCPTDPKPDYHWMETNLQHKQDGHKQCYNENSSSGL